MVLEVSLCLAHLGVHACKLTIPAPGIGKPPCGECIQLCWLAGRWNEGSHGGGVEDFPALGGPSKVTMILYASSISSPSHS